jgi:hypothetical protein
LCEMKQLQRAYFMGENRPSNVLKEGGRRREREKEREKERPTHKDDPLRMCWHANPKATVSTKYEK